MANVLNPNVRFYKLGVLPDFDVSKHVGIFVHVTTGDTEHKAGLWFGGTIDWEYLTNDTNSGTINAAIDAKIQELDVNGYAQATITTNTPTEGEPNSTLTISGIKEVDGKIAIDNNNNNKLEVAIDGGYDKTTNKIATQTTVKNAIEGLNTTETIQAVTTAPAEGNTANTVLTFKGVKESNGVILQGTGNETLTVGNAKLKIQIGLNTVTDVFSANAQADSTIKLDELVFNKKNRDVISVITPTAVSESNKLVTQQDVANLAGAMHYKGTIANAGDAWPTTVKAGDVYIATGENFKKEGQVIESGDMIVFNSESLTNFTVVQSNITSGIKFGQIAKNDSDLTPNNMVIATSTGIKTIGITETQLTGADNNTRTLVVTNGTIDDNGLLHHAVTITDTFKVIGKDFSKSINISSNNRSINIANNGDTGVMVDLVWNTSIE